MRKKDQTPGFVRRSREGDSTTLHLRVLGYKEDSEWCALCLEMDLVGYGPTFDDAMDDLEKYINNQFTFAMQMNDLSLLEFSADQEYHDRFSHALNLSIREKLTGQQEEESLTAVGELPVPALESLNTGAYAPA